ncbi:hypothetical protein GQ600_24236 [Phytophthora cactorum]|nr:hypothetical protein GQ600_24236 [Phytophthora cactorum]
MIGGKAVNPSPIDADRTQMYVDSRKGRQNQEDGAEQVEQHYLTLHLVQLRSDESFEHNWSWSEKETLTSSPGSVIEWYVLIRRESLGGSGAKNFTGVIRPWEEGDEKYFWVVGFDHGATPDAELDIEELAEILNYTYLEKYDFIQ